MNYNELMKYFVYVMLTGVMAVMFFSLGRGCEQNHAKPTTPIMTTPLDVPGNNLKP
jgi:hypothetical protein